MSISLFSLPQLTNNVYAASALIPVASTGTSNDSTVIQAAINRAVPGDTILLTSSSYKLTAPIVLNKDGAAGKTIKLKSSDTAKIQVKLDFTGEPDGDSSYGINITN